MKIKNFKITKVNLTDLIFDQDTKIKVLFVGKDKNGNDLEIELDYRTLDIRHSFDMQRGQMELDISCIGVNNESNTR